MSYGTKENPDDYVYFTKRPEQDATVRRFLQDPITPQKVKTLDNGEILYRFSKALLSVEGDTHTPEEPPK